MTNVQQRSEIKKAINRYCESKGISKRELSTQIGISDATLSKIENEDWSNISDRMFRKIWNRVGNDLVPLIFSTRDYRAGLTACEHARKNRQMIGIVGDTGTGKTTLLTSYAMRKNVFYVSYDKTMKPKQFFVALLREMGISFEGNLHDMVNLISDELNTLNSPLVIIDEAGKITHSMMLYLHVIRDKTVKNCGIVLGGMPYFKSNLVKFSNKQKEGYAEFLRRINLWHSLDGLSRTEITEICTAHGIDDKEVIKDMQVYKRLGDLHNQITLFKLETTEV